MLRLYVATYKHNSKYNSSLAL